jgi:signal transduction histidine kinase
MRGLFIGGEPPLYVGGDPRDRERFTMLLDGAARVRTGVERLWVSDTAGRLLHDTVFVDPAFVARDAAHWSTTADSAVLRAASTRAVARAIRGRRHAVEVLPRRRGDTSRRLVVVEPLMVRGRVVGVAGALMSPRDLLRPVGFEIPSLRRELVVHTGVDTVLRMGTASGRREHADTLLRVDGATTWRIEVAHGGVDARVQRTLWSLGALAVVFLAIGLSRERRQSMRIAERSAELERLSSELLRANRMKSEFLANVSHELRTPLNAIVGFVELLRDGVYGDLAPRQEQPVARIAASASHLRHLVDQVLDIAKIAAGRLEVHPEPIVLRPFVINVVGELESLAAERGLSLSVGVSASLPRVRTDPAHLRQILINLIGNALKYTERGGIVVRARLVGARRSTPVPPPDPNRPVAERTTPDDSTLAERAPRAEHPWIALQVIDTGSGIATEDQERIFDEFEQVNAGPRGESMRRGTGLGLAISRRLARLIGGEIVVDSEVAKGSTFTIWLPVSPAELQARREARA